jgi:endoglucanase
MRRVVTCCSLNESRLRITGLLFLGFVLGQGACGSTQKPGSTNESAIASQSASGTTAAETTTPASTVSKHKLGENPFVGAKWWEDPYAQAHLRALRAKAKGDAETAELMGKIARNGGADWIGEWTPYVERWIDKRITLLNKHGALPYFVAYNIPKRDCGQYSAGGASKAQVYKDWITSFAHGIGARKAVVILEPDGLPLLKKCLSDADQKERIDLIRFAVHTFEALPQTWVYMDAGHSGWIPAPEMAERLKAAGIAEADGFSLNVSNYQATDVLMTYGKQLGALVGGKHFVIDTSRNGNGAPDADKDSEAAWCNPDGRAVGVQPTSETSEPLCDAFLWIKKPGESDGTCNGGPKAGEWWQERAVDLVKRAKW